MHRDSHFLKLTIISVNVKLPIQVGSWLRQFNLTSGIFSAHPVYSWVSEQVNFMQALEELNDAGIVLYFCYG